ncbi:MAG: hypothetical protein ACYC3U_10955, partial [Georgenia sp.]
MSGFTLRPEGRTARNLRKVAPPDAGTGVLTLYLAALMYVPANLTFAPLGAAGTPSQIVGLLAGVLWLLTRLERTTGVGGRAQPIRIAMLLFVLAVLVSYVAA